MHFILLTNALELYQQMLLLLQDRTTVTTLTRLVWLAKNLTVQTLFIKQCEKFYSAVQSGQDTFTLTLKSTHSGTTSNFS